MEDFKKNKLCSQINIRLSGIDNKIIVLDDIKSLFSHSIKKIEFITNNDILIKFLKRVRQNTIVNRLKKGLDQKIISTSQFLQVGEELITREDNSKNNKVLQMLKDINEKLQILIETVDVLSEAVDKLSSVKYK